MSIKIESASVSGLELPEFSMYMLSEGIQGLSKALEWCHDDSSFPSEATLDKAALQLGYALRILADMNDALVCELGDVKVERKGAA